MGSDMGSADNSAIHIVIDRPLRNTCARHISENMGNQSAERSKEFFDSLYAMLQLSKVDNIRDYHFFLLIRKLSKMLKLVPKIKHKNNSDQNIAEFLRSITKAAKLYKQTRDMAISYLILKKDYIFSENQPDCELKSDSLDFIIECKREIDDYPLYKYLCQECSHLIISRFDELSYVFNKYNDLFFELFPSGHIDLQNMAEAQAVLKIWAKEYCKENSQFRQSAKKYAAALYQDAEALGERLSFDNVIEIAPLIEAIGSFLNEVQSPKANCFSKYEGKTENLKRKCFYHNVKIFMGISKIPHIEMWKASLDQKLLDLTHFINAVSNENKSYLSLIKDASNTYGDCGNSSSFRTADSLECYKTILFFELLGDKAALDDYSSFVSRAVHDVSVKISQEKGELEKDAVLLLGMLRSAAGNINEPGLEQEISCYSASVFLCSLTDKLLRLFYLSLKKDKKYIPAGKTTLGRLLNNKDEDLEKAFDSDHQLGLAYFLVTVTGIQVGKNYRNSLAHWASGMSPEDMNPILTASLLWIFTDVLNSVHLYFDSQTKVNPTADESVDCHD